MKHYPGVVILGPRQVGKTTLVSQLFGHRSEGGVLTLDLENPADENKLRQPEIFFQRHRHQTIVIDEVQRMPELFPLLRHVIDQDRRVGRFVLLGSSSEALILQSTESLAGRVSYHEMHPLHVGEIPAEHAERLWMWGGYPLAYLQAEEPKQSERWLQQMIVTHIQRELAQKQLGVTATEMEKLLRMLASVHGQTVNIAELGRLMQRAQPTVERYLQFLEQAYFIRRVYPFATNTLKRLVKSPKLYIRDSGLFHVLSGWSSLDEVESDIQCGFAWEGFVLQQVYAMTSAFVPKYFYRSQAGAEVDLVTLKGNKPYIGFEMKYGTAPKLTKSSVEAMKDLQCKKYYVVTPGYERYMLHENVEVVGVTHLPEVIEHHGLGH